MQLTDFKIGVEFKCGDQLYRCTDVGSRVVIAIRVDQVNAVAYGQHYTVPRKDAEKAGWFNGPPYAVAECVFDEDSLPACELIAT